MRRLLLALILTALVGAAASVPSASAARGAGCRTAEVQVHNEAVFGHFATLAGAKALEKRAEAVSFQGIKIENDGCGDYEVEIDGADRVADRVSFAAEAQKAGFQVTFEQTRPPLERKPDTRSARPSGGREAARRRRDDEAGEFGSGRFPALLPLGAAACPDDLLGLRA
jgi:hypothetical protein